LKIITPASSSKKWTDGSNMLYLICGIEIVSLTINHDLNTLRSLDIFIEF